MPFDSTQTNAKLKRLGIPVADTQLLEQVYVLEGVSLSSAVDRAIESGDAAAKAYLQGIFFNLLPGVGIRLRTANIETPPLAALVGIGKTEGPRFSKILKRWVDQGCPVNAEGAYLKKVVQKWMPAANTDLASECSWQGSAIQQPAEYEIPPASQINAGASKTYVNRHVYGGKVALCFSSDTTRNNQHTVRVEAAEAGSGSYKWDDKISIQFSERELPGVLATFLQLQVRFEGKGHGTQHEKWFTLDNQPGKVFMTVNQKGKASRSVPIGPGDCFGVVTLLMEQMLKNSSFLTADTLLSLVKRTGQMSSSQAT